MCYNCGCGEPNNKMGHDENITDEDFKKAAEAMGQTEEEAKKETLKMLKKQFGQEE